jgi:hypothetical protein
VSNEKTLPELLEAVCTHTDCPQWLKHGIWDLFGEQSHTCQFTSEYWAMQFRAIREANEEVPDDKN